MTDTSKICLLGKVERVSCVAQVWIEHLAQEIQVEIRRHLEKRVPVFYGVLTGLIRHPRHCRPGDAAQIVERIAQANALPDCIAQVRVGNGSTIGIDKVLFILGGHTIIGFP